MRMADGATSPPHKVAHGGRRSDHSSAQRAADSRGETMEQLLDRNLAELLQELRVAFTGVQILFAFLLSLAFTQRFSELDGFDITVYVVALVSTALATMVLLAPVSFHRIVFRRGQKAALVLVADRLLMLGLALLIPAICSAVLLILDVVLGRWQAIVGSAVTVTVGLVTWYAMPIVVRRAGSGGAAGSHRRQESDGRVTHQG
ncbi:MAG TPA: DUF6328 family protein [Blastococcus sp.]|nr:DUF6328 family protein [Blastococcus sp.]